MPGGVGRVRELRALRDSQGRRLWTAAATHLGEAWTPEAIRMGEDRHRYVNELRYRNAGLPQA